MTEANFTRDPEIIKTVPNVDICACQVPLPFEFSMAFQPIWDHKLQRVFAYEALARGVNGEGAGTILSQVTQKIKYAFDQASRVTAIRLATELGMPDGAYLSINFLPNAIYDPETCIRATLDAARLYDFPHNRIMFEMTEHESMGDTSHFKTIIEAYQRLGFTTAIDDFGEGYSGLNLLSNFQPDIIKIDMHLVQGIARDPVKRAIVRGITVMALDLGIDLVAEGVERKEDFRELADMGVRYFQGYLLARPGFQAMPEVDLSAISSG
ncbi:MAG: EAL domain-containing protein [Natronospirillum sp.]|uniref:EAL domain-containing protein n=1 Tax=Natronospirillum sp. TaxID=2812955 RepID=UPI0025EDA872|nr:EAL domain-containing protein [Natronospirillum sp.]MCH8551492.1 EAL domain-containing protein [Natronospirillum sp.]